MASDVTPIDLDHLSLDSFAGRPVAVLGLARSGVALARFFAARGAEVTVYDGRPRDQLASRAASRSRRQVPRCCLGRTSTRVPRSTARR